MGSEVAYYGEDKREQVVDIHAMQQQLTDLDEAILLVQRIHVRKAELTRIYTTLSDNLAPQALKALPPSTIKEYSRPAEHSFITSDEPMIDSVIRYPDEEPFYHKTWFYMSCTGAAILGGLALIWLMMVGIMAALSNLSNGISSWWAASGTTVLGIGALIILVLFVLMRSGGGGTFSGTFQGRWR